MSHKTTLRVVHETEVERDRIVDWIFANLGEDDQVELVDDHGDAVLLAENPLGRHGRELENRIETILDGDGFEP